MKENDPLVNRYSNEEDPGEQSEPTNEDDPYEEEEPDDGEPGETMRILSNISGSRFSQ
jgi:hypothetical protein